jgi:hypothetical protein
LDVTPVAAGAIARDAIGRIRSGHLVAQAGSDLIIRGKVSMSGRSWGETLEIEISPLDNGGSELSISSTPRLLRTLIDYGKNRANVRLLSMDIASSGGGTVEAS